PVTALTHPHALDASLTSGIVKIDPPVHSETDIRKINAIGLDYVLMFIPVEPAFLLALDKQPELITEALKNNIMLVSPTTLL
ncbi:DNA recombination protein RmuC, partial [Salmonella enterica subsp. enterica serovar Kentucky]|nr:DNA recombination protein RmuC [Salmonella enterica subsp. enterica serovar Kentucky]